VLSIEDLESLERTLEIMSNPSLVEAIREGRRDVASGRTEKLSREEAHARIAER
jgi:PHD/YefM family antitoxin component YafN of YafNO toxin-antitoxin module